MSRSENYGVCPCKAPGFAPPSPRPPAPHSACPGHRRSGSRAGSRREASCRDPESCRDGPTHRGWSGPQTQTLGSDA